MRRDYRRTRFRFGVGPVVSERHPGARGHDHGFGRDIPLMDVAVRLAVKGRVAVDMAIAPGAAYVLRRKVARAIDLRMRVPFAEHLGARGDALRRGCGIQHAAVPGAHVAADYRAFDESTGSVDEPEVFPVAGKRSVQAELRPDMRQDLVLRAAWISDGIVRVRGSAQTQGRPEPGVSPRRVNRHVTPAIAVQKGPSKPRFRRSGPRNRLVQVGRGSSSRGPVRCQE